MALCVCDKRLPLEAKENLSRFGDMLEFTTKGVTYDAISGHPDIFFCKARNDLIVSPNVPEEYISTLNKKHIDYKLGSTLAQIKYPQSAAYNGALNDNFLIHRIDITDPVILESASHLEMISVQQGYTRCSLLPLKNNSFITSDAKICKKLCDKDFNVLYVEAREILLPGFPHGFFGGVCGVHEDAVFVAGNLNFFRYGQHVREFLRSLKYNIIELYNGPLFDCGSILFID